MRLKGFNKSEIFNYDGKQLTFNPSKHDKGDYTITIKLADDHYVNPMSTSYNIKLSVVAPNPP